MYVCACTCVCVCMYMCVCVCVCACTCVCVCACMYMHACECMLACKHVCVCVCLSLSLFLIFLLFFWHSVIIKIEAVSGAPSQKISKCLQKAPRIGVRGRGVTYNVKCVHPYTTTLSIILCKHSMSLSCKPMHYVNN